MVEVKDDLGRIVVIVVRVRYLQNPIYRNPRRVEVVLQYFAHDETNEKG
jgi:hypothetical protein